MSKKHPQCVIIDGNGDPCPRCKRPTQIREHAVITDKRTHQPFYYSRWFNCTYADCKTTLIMPERFKVLTDAGKRQIAERERLLAEEGAIAAAADDVVMQVANEMADDGDVPWSTWRRRP